MRIVCVGAGPAGLYFAILAKLRDPAAEVRVLERSRRGVTAGWGIVFWEDLLSSLTAGDPVTARELRASSQRWRSEQVYLDGHGTAEMGGYGYTVGRTTALELLTARALELGARVDFSTEIDPAEVPDADLVVLSDGARSRTRTQHAARFGTRITTGENRFIWLGTDQVFDSFKFAFVKTAGGWIWFHGYRFDATTSTCIVECPPGTWSNLGFGTLDQDETMARLGQVFAPLLGGHPLSAGRPGQPPARWLRFDHVVNTRWSLDNMVLVGDAAHTTHYSVGSGTKLALEDAIALDRAIGSTTSVAAATSAYQELRAGPVGERQHAAQASQAWFENVPRLLDRAPDAVSFAYQLRTRREPSAARSRVGWLLHRATQHPVGLRAHQAVSEVKLARMRRQAAHHSG
jgi:anthraniloyl-CoA monooxygenase